MKDIFERNRELQITQMEIDDVSKLYASLIEIRRNGFISNNDNHEQADSQDNWDITEGLRHDMEICRRRLREHYRMVGKDYNELNRNK